MGLGMELGQQVSEKKSSGGGNGWLGGALGLAGGVLGMLTRKSDNRNQIEQQRKLNEVNAATSMGLMDYQNKKQLEMANATSAPWQVEQLKKAGLSVGLAYGGSGAGGQLGGGIPSAGGGSADGAAASSGARQGMAMMAAQLGLIGAQKENIEAQTEKTKEETGNIGVDTGNKTTQGKLMGVQLEKDQFAMDVLKGVGLQDFVKAETAAQRKIEAEGMKQWQEWRAWEAAGFEGEAFDKADTPVAKAIKAGLDTVVQDLANAKMKNDLDGAELKLRRFEGKMSDLGIARNSPWYTKIIATIMGKAGFGDILK